MTTRRPLVQITGTIQELPVGDDTPGGGVAVDFGDGVATSYVLTHSLNTLDVEVQFRRNAVPRSQVLIAWEALTVNSIQVKPAVAPALNELRALVKKVA